MTNTSSSVLLPHLTVGARRFPGLRVFLLYLICYVVLFWPALCQPWWYMDDYWCAGWDGATFWKMALCQGRPLGMLWQWTHQLDSSPESGTANVLLRLVQVGCHVLTATLIAGLLWKDGLRWPGVAAVLPFVLWAFNPEAVLWRTGAAYALTALLSVGGVVLLRGRTRGSGMLGMVCLALSVLGCQAPAAIGLLVWIVLVAVRLTRPGIEGQKGFFPWWVREGTLLGTGLLLGGVVSLLLTRLFPFPFRDTALASDWRGKARYFLHLQQLTWFYPHFYCWPAQLSHAALLAATAWAILTTALTWQRRCLIAVVLLSSLVAPFAGVLVVSESFASWRLLYPAPLIFTGFLSLAFLLGSARLRLGLAAITASILFWNAPLAWRNAAEYPRLEQCDREQARCLERFCQQQGMTRVVVLPGAVPVYKWNPYGLQMFDLHGHYSAFKTSWTCQQFLQRYSSLQPVNPELAGPLAPRTNQQNFTFVVNAEQQCVMVVTP